MSFKIANIQVNGNNNNSIKLYLHDYNKVLQYCKSYLKLSIDSFYQLKQFQINILIIAYF